MGRKYNRQMTPKQRQERWEKCIGYMSRYGSLPEAMAAAKKDGVSFNTSVWLSALGKMLERGQRPKGMPEVLVHRRLRSSTAKGDHG